MTNLQDPSPRSTAAAPAVAGRDLTLLGHSERQLPASPAEACLEFFPNPAPHREFTITLDCAEFTSLCPITGQPDYARLRIEYVPGERCVETKSLKFYLASFRDERAFNEALVNRILDDFVRACAPRRASVRGEFGARGGISLSVVAVHPQPSAAPEDVVAH